MIGKGREVTRRHHSNLTRRRIQLLAMLGDRLAHFDAALILHQLLQARLARKIGLPQRYHRLFGISVLHDQVAGIATQVEVLDLSHRS
jgi:hypothetical protein